MLKFENIVNYYHISLYIIILRIISCKKFFKLIIEKKLYYKINIHIIKINILLMFKN